MLETRKGVSHRGLQGTSQVLVCPTKVRFSWLPLAGTFSRRGAQFSYVSRPTARKLKFSEIVLEKKSKRNEKRQLTGGSPPQEPTAVRHGTLSRVGYTRNNDRWRMKKSGTKKQKKIRTRRNSVTKSKSAILLRDTEARLCARRLLVVF